jgi:hypothetical protein
MVMFRGLGIFLLLIPVIVGGCDLPPPRPRRTQLEVRQVQTRTYDNRDAKQVMKAVINTLQDDGFIIRSADRELGYVTANKDFEVGGGFGGFSFQFYGPGQEPRYDRMATLEASINVSEFGKETRVRAVFQRRVVDNFGAPSSAFQIEEPGFYQQFFYKVDKSLFIEREGL